MLSGIRFGEILVILLVVLVLFGKDRLPNIGSSLGQAIRNFKRGFTGEETEAPPTEPGKIASGGVTTAATTTDPSKVAANK